MHLNKPKFIKEAIKKKSERQRLFSVDAVDILYTNNISISSTRIIVSGLFSVCIELFIDYLRYRKTPAVVSSTTSTEKPIDKLSIEVPEVTIVVNELGSKESLDSWVVADHGDGAFSPSDSGSQHTAWFPEDLDTTMTGEKHSIGLGMSRESSNDSNVQFLKSLEDVIAEATRVLESTDPDHSDVSRIGISLDSNSGPPESHEDVIADSTPGGRFRVPVYGYGVMPRVGRFGRVYSILPPPPNTAATVSPSKTILNGLEEID